MVTEAAVSNSGKPITRKEFLKKAAYTTPVVLTLAAKPAYAQPGSGMTQIDPPSFGG